MLILAPPLPFPKPLVRCGAVDTNVNHGAQASYSYINHPNPLFLDEPTATLLAFPSESCPESFKVWGLNARTLEGNSPPVWLRVKVKAKPWMGLFPAWG